MIRISQLSVFICLFSLSIFGNIENISAQTYSWSGFTTTTNSSTRTFTSGNLSATVTATPDGGSTGYSYGSTSQIGGSGVCGGTPNGLFLEMSGASSSWNNTINVAISFSSPVIGPVTFNAYDLNEPIWTGDNSSYYDDQVTISAVDQNAAAIGFASIVYGGCASSSGSISNTATSRTLTARTNSDGCSCTNASVTINTSGGQGIKKINILYRNGTPTNSKYGVCQFQNIVISSIVVNGILPVELLKFEGYCNENSTELNWSTASEKNNNYFTIERSADGQDFYSAAVVPSKAPNGYSSSQLDYSASDHSFESGSAYYYRLKQTDYDGRFSYSDVIYVNCVQDIYSDMVLYPNPADDQTNLKFNSPFEGKIVYTITDALGKAVSNSKQMAVSKGSEVTIDTKDLPGGIYQIRLTESSKKVSFPVMKLVVGK